ncbi:hypothetical protein SGRA_2069 [Saprospira grandis str. Lewin]|uniref:Uncharacterized protein n=1 Tax=Saprospira grandis (strain Lewin) TaxID=984262 RepID=H6L2P3_SAPGL|nr:hypothetical protein SGRA_2069 [Saprospira grandis str. Lewin]
MILTQKKYKRRFFRHLFDLQLLNINIFIMIGGWGLLPAAGATFRSSQVCSALRRFQRLGLACGHCCTSLGR